MPSLYLKYKYSDLFLVYHCILIIISYVTWSIVVLVLLPAMMVLKLVQELTHLVIWMRNEGDLVHSTDYPFLLESKHHPHNIVSICEVNGLVETEYIRSIYKEKLLDPMTRARFEKLRKRVAVKFNSFLWADEPDFSFDRHIIKYNGPLLDSEEKRKRYLLEIGLESFPELQSPWKVIIVNESEHKDKTFIYFCVHHVLGDGFSLLGLFICLLDSPPKFLSASHKHGVMSDLTKRIINGILTGPLALLTLAISYISNNPFQLKAKNHQTPSPNDRNFEFIEDISLQKVKKLKTALNCTVNDIILSAYSGGFRRYLLEKSPGKNPDDVSIALSFNKRSARDISHGYPTLTNRSAGALIPLPVSEPNRAKRLHMCKRRCNILKNSSDGHTFDFIFSRFLSWIPYFLGKYAASALSLHCSAILSNVPGPIEPVHINGFEVERLAASVPLMYSLGLTITVFSYKGLISSSILADRSVVSDVKRLLDLFKEELELIELEVDESVKDKSQ